MIRVTQELIEERYNLAKAQGHSKAKWLVFCELLLKTPLKVELCASKSTRSKYIYLYLKGKKKMKVRFSDHREAVSAKRDTHFVGHDLKGNKVTTKQMMERVLVHFDLMESHGYLYHMIK